jgi:hypothetical protein
MTLSINKLTKLSLIVLLLSILLSFIGIHNLFDQKSSAIVQTAPLNIMVSQAIWNATKVFFYILLTLNLVTKKDKLSKVFVGISIILLPFSQYLVSPGGVFLTVLIFSLFFYELRNKHRVINITMSEGKISKRFSIKKYETLAFLCCLLCSLYNARASTTCFPYWGTWFTWLNDLLKWPQEASSFVSGLYTMGLNIPIPASLPHANYNGFGLLSFSLIWSILPFLYVLYFSALYIESKNSPYANTQKLLCAFCIFHFLFLTNLVGYRFSRGWDNAYADWFHWSEKVAWRIAILLPIYQSLCNGFWKKESKKTFLHIFMVIWGLIFLIYQVMFYDSLAFISFVRGEPLTVYESIRPYYLYHRALVIMTLYYLFRIIFNSKSHLWKIQE